MQQHLHHAEEIFKGPPSSKTISLLLMFSNNNLSFQPVNELSKPGKEKENPLLLLLAWLSLKPPALIVNCEGRNKGVNTAVCTAHRHTHTRAQVFGWPHVDVRHGQRTAACCCCVLLKSLCYSVPPHSLV